MNEKEVEQLKKWSKDILKEHYDKFDFNAEIDKKISLEENKTIMRDKFKVFFNIVEAEALKSRKKAELMPKEQHELLILQEVKKAEEQAELEFNASLIKIAQTESSNILEEIYMIPKNYAKAVASGNSTGLLLYGEAGLGKTYSVIRGYKEAGKNFVLLNGHITALALYQYLYEHRKEHIILDDVNILENEQNLNLLKACLSENSRIVHYNTSSPRLRVPSQFIFEGSLIILLNHKPKDSESLKAVESRILTYELKLDYETKIKAIFEIAKMDYKGINKEERLEIARFLKENTSQATENLNLRLLFNLFSLYKFNKDLWKTLAKGLIRNDENLMMIVQVLEGNALKEAERKYCEMTGYSSRTFWRHYSKLNGRKNGKTLLRQI